MKYTKEEIEKILNDSIQELVKKESFLIQESVNERSITSKLACYLMPFFSGYSVDVEYNKMNGSIEPKTLKILQAEVSNDNSNASTVYPDIIVHKREDNKSNLLIIEAKKSNSTVNHKQDYKKLDGYMQELGYKYSAFVIFDVDNPKESKVEVKIKRKNWL